MMQAKRGYIANAEARGDIYKLTGDHEAPDAVAGALTKSPDPIHISHVTLRLPNRRACF